MSPFDQEIAAAFNTGFEGGLATGSVWRLEYHLEVSTLRAVAELNGRIVTTIYPGRPKWPKVDAGKPEGLPPQAN